MRRSLPFIVISFAALAACTFDYEEGAVEARDDGGVPQVVIHDARMVIVRDNRVELTADRIASYPDENVQRFEGIAFREYGPDGELRLEGSAGGGLIYLDTEDIELSGGVTIWSAVEDGSVESERLFWDADGSILRTGDEGFVTLRRSDGTWIEAGGIRVDGRRNRIEFHDGVQGAYRSSDEADEERGR